MDSSWHFTYYFSCLSLVAPLARRSLVAPQARCPMVAPQARRPMVAPQARRPMVALRQGGAVRVRLS